MAERNLAIEVVVSWDGNPLDTTLVTAPLVVGPGAGAWFGLPREVIAENHELIARREGAWILRAPAGAELKVSGDRAPVVDAGARCVRLDEATSAEVRLGRFAFFVRASDAAIEAAPKLALEWKWMRWLGAAAVLHGIFLTMFAMTPPAAGALSLDRADARTRYLTIRLDGAERTPPEPRPVVTASAGDAGGSSDSAGAVGGGESATPVESSSPGPRRPDGRRQPVVATAENVTDLGVLRVLGREPMSFGDGRSPYTAGSEQVGAGGLANATLLNMPGGPRFGALDMGGTGVGTCDPRRQDCTAGTVGVGPLATRDPGDGRVPGLRDRSPGAAPGGLRTLPPETRGGLTQEQVRRTVRQHINEVRFCYEQALVRRPDLEGRVSAVFMISQSGAVQSAAVSSSVNDPRVAGCVRDAVTRWTFPRSEGMTAVTYPFLMQATE